MFSRDSCCDGIGGCGCVLGCSEGWANFVAKELESASCFALADVDAACSSIRPSADPGLGDVSSNKIRGSGLAAVAFTVGAAPKGGDAGP